MYVPRIPLFFGLAVRHGARRGAGRGAQGGLTEDVGWRSSRYQGRAGAEEGMECWWASLGALWCPKPTLP